jgi:hypothetical protein
MASGDLVVADDQSCLMSVKLSSKGFHLSARHEDDSGIKFRSGSARFAGGRFLSRS